MSPEKANFESYSEGPDNLTNSEALDRHENYYFAFTIFLVSDIYDSDQAD
jgi:hypothetical protein